MAVLVLFLAYFAIGLIWYFRNRLRAPLFQIMAAPALMVLLWPIFLYSEILTLWSAKRFRVGFAAYDSEQPLSMEIPEYKFFASWADAIVFAKDLTRSSGRKVTIHDEARYDQGLSGYSPRYVTLTPAGEVVDTSSSRMRCALLKQAKKLELQVNQNSGVPISNLRSFASILLGTIYGMSVWKGFELGLEYVLQENDSGLLEWPLIYAAVRGSAGGAGAFLAAYSAQSAIYGIIAAALICADTIGVHLLEPELLDGYMLAITLVLTTVLSLASAFYGSKLPLGNEDAIRGLFLGVSWKHWLWLWIPFFLMIANAVWAVVSLSRFLGLGMF